MSTTKKKKTDRKKGKISWCHRTLVSAPIHYALCTSEDAFNKEVKRLSYQYPIDWLGDGVKACTHFFEADEGGTLAIVCIPVDIPYGMPEVAGLLAHEGMHVWQEVLKVTGEDKPSSEFEAYSVQHIVHNLMAAYLNHKQG